MKTSRRGFLGMVGAGAAALATGATGEATTEPIKLDYDPTEKELKFINKLINNFVQQECDNGYLKDMGDMPLVVSGDLYNGEAQFHIQTKGRVKSRYIRNTSLRSRGVPTEPYVKKLKDILDGNVGDGKLALVWGPELDVEDKGEYISTSLPWRGRSGRMDNDRVNNIANHIGNLLKEMGFHVIVSITVQVESFRNEGMIG